MGGDGAGGGPPVGLQRSETKDRIKQAKQLTVLVATGRAPMVFVIRGRQETRTFHLSLVFSW